MTAHQLSKMSEHHNTILLTLDGYPSLNVEKLLGELSGVKRVELSHAENERVTYRIYPENEVHIEPAVSQLVREQEWVVDGLVLERGRLDDVFRQLTLGDA